MPAPARNYLYTDYALNLHRWYVAFAQSPEDQLLAALRTCFQEFIDSKGRGNLDVRIGVQNMCIAETVDALWQRESQRIYETSC
jgi:hypothetical protein